jgi:hypothetical protein
MFKKIKPDDENDVLVEHVEINLDGCGKHFLVLALFVCQIASIATFCLLFVQFYLRECNPAAYHIAIPSLQGIL